MRIVQVAPWYHPHIGGTESIVRTLSKGLAARGHEVTVVTTRHDPSLPSEETLDGCRVIRVKPRTILFRTPVAPRTRSVVDALDADVIHAHSPPPLSAYYASSVASARRIPFIVTYQCDVEVPTPVGPLVEAIYRRSLGASTLRRAKKVIVTTHAYAATSRTVWRSSPVIIPNAVDSETFRPDIDGAPVRERLGIPPERPVALLVARIVPHKGIEHFIQAARFVPYAEFLVVGDGPQLEALKRLAASIGVQDRVRFLGHVRDLPEVYAACDVFVLPSVSRLEAFGIVTLEAMATGKPVVITDIPGVREVIEDGLEGLLADPMNPEDLGAKIRIVLADPARGRAMGLRGREKVLASFGADRVVSLNEAVYAAAVRDVRR